MIESKKQIFIIVGIFTLILALTSVTYAFFNYTRTGLANTIRVGNIYFNTTEGTALNITNAFPMTSTEALNANLDSVTVGIVGNTTYNDGEEFIVTLVDVNNTINSKEVPMNYIASYTAATGGTIGTSSNDYYNARESKDASLYVLNSTGKVEEGKRVLMGYIDNGSTGINGTLTIKAYIDADRIAISDTYNAPTATPNDNMGTTSEWVDGRTVFTTTEWNGLSNNPISFKIRVESNEGIWVEDDAPICKRVTNVANLHTEKCTNSTAQGYCQADGYALNSNITYGRAVALGTNTLTAGDAFDCKISSNGDYTERFYYLNSYYNTADDTYDSEYAVLVYYSSTISGATSDAGSMYGDDNWHGPSGAASNLPTASAWNNVKLKSLSRTIWSCSDANCGSKALTTGNGSNTITPNPYLYSTSSRLLTMQEIITSRCNTAGTYQVSGALKNCNFLLEGTKYANSSKPTNGIWVENPQKTDIGTWYINAYGRLLSYDSPITTSRGARPVIEIPVSRILK